MLLCFEYVNYNYFPHISEHETELRQESDSNVSKRQEDQFPTWFRNKVSYIFRTSLHIYI